MSGVRRRRLIENPIDRQFRIGIQHEDLAEVRVRVAQQLHAILFRTGERLFMAMDHSGRIVFHGAHANEALAFQGLARYRAR